jgi:hypothetical protein
MVEREGPGRRQTDNCVTELRVSLESHLKDYRVLRDDMDNILVLLNEIHGGLRVVRWIGYMVTSGFLIGLWHAASAFFTGHWK